MLMTRWLVGLAFAMFATAEPDPVPGSVPYGTFWAGFPTCSVDNCLGPLLSQGVCTEDYGCICQSISFLTQLAQCVGNNCPSEADPVYYNLTANCDDHGGYTLPLADFHFLAIAGQFWEGYPSCSVNSCLNPILAMGGCEVDDNECVCTNTTFLSQIASCIGNSCPADVAGVYKGAKGSCMNFGGFTFGLSQNQWDSDAGLTPSSTTSSILPAASSSTPVATTPPATSPSLGVASSGSTTTTATTSNPAGPSAMSTGGSGNGNGGLAHSDIIAIAVPIGLFALGIALAVVGFFIKPKMRQKFKLGQPHAR